MPYHLAFMFSWYYFYGLPSKQPASLVSLIYPLQLGGTIVPKVNQMAFEKLNKILQVQSFQNAE